MGIEVRQTGRTTTSLLLLDLLRLRGLGLRLRSLIQPGFRAI
jgi:hypothetical protein